MTAKSSVDGVELIKPENIGKKGNNINSFIIIDVREEEAFEAGNIPGSLNMPKATHRWPSLKAGVRQGAFKKRILIVDEGGNGDGVEVADLITKVLKKSSGVLVLEGGMRNYISVSEKHSGLPFEGEYEMAEDAPILPKISGQVRIIEKCTPLEDEDCVPINEIASIAFGASIHDLPKELKYDSSVVNRELKRLRLHGQEPLTDSGYRYRVFCAYEKSSSGPTKRRTTTTTTTTTTATEDSSESDSDAPLTRKRRRETDNMVQTGSNDDTLIGFLVMKHSSVDSCVKQRLNTNWAVVKYVCGIKKGVGYALQQAAWRFCGNILNIDRVFAGAWLEFPNAWISHIRWGYRHREFIDWPRGANSAYGAGIIGMCKELRGKDHYYG